MTTELTRRRCEPCHSGTPRLRGDELREYEGRVDPRWRIVEDHHLEADFSFPDFMEAVRFANRVGALAEAEGHHPDIHLSWGRALVRIWTHAIDGLSENDFILAAKVDELVGA